MQQRLEEAGFDLENPLIARVLAVTEMLRDHPRHLSQHVGGFVISDAPLSTVVPVENAAMVDRTIIQWDKDDLETLGLLKVDCLGVGHAHLHPQAPWTWCACIAAAISNWRRFRVPMRQPTT